MIHRLYTLRDNVAHKIGTIVVFENDETAMRAVQASSRRDDMLVRCSRDFDLVCIGEIDLGFGNITPVMRVVCSVDNILTRDSDVEASNAN